MAGRLIELPAPRGPFSEQLFEALEGPVEAQLKAPSSVDSADPIADEDLQLALYVSYELHYTAIRGVDERWEWSPSLLAFRATLERPFEEAVAELVPPADSRRSWSRSARPCRRSSPRTPGRRSPAIWRRRERASRCSSTSSTAPPTS